MDEHRPIYLDYQAHAPIDRRVAEVMARAFVQYDANPHSAHRCGRLAHEAVELARAQVAALIGADPAEIVFTSGATESNNLALGGLRARLETFDSDSILVSAGEHPSVLAAADRLGVRVAHLPLLPTGIVDLDALDRMLSAGAGLVSAAWANHEIGTIQPMAEIGARVHKAGALLHSDLAQAAGKVAVDAALLDVASVSSHKLGGPVGVGALYVRRSLRRHMRAIMHGGDQEGGLRSGTVPAPLCVAFGEACMLASREMRAEAVRVAELRDSLLERLSAVGGLAINGGPDRLPGNLNVSFEGVDGEALVLRLRDKVAIATGSACSSSSLDPSHVLAAIGVVGRRAEGAIRISLGRQTTPHEVVLAAEMMVAAVVALRATKLRAA